MKLLLSGKDHYTLEEIGNMESGKVSRRIHSIGPSTEGPNRAVLSKMRKNDLELYKNNPV